MMAYEPTRNKSSSVAGDPTVFIGEEDEHNNVRFSISMSELIAAALDRQILNTQKRTILVTGRSVRGDVSDRESDLDSTPGSPSNEDTETFPLKSPRISPPLSLTNDIGNMHLLAGKKLDQEDDDNAPRLPIKLLMKNRYRLPQEEEEGQGSFKKSGAPEAGALDLSISKTLRDESVLRLIATKPNANISEQRTATIDIDPDTLKASYTSVSKEDKKSLHSDLQESTIRNDDENENCMNSDSKSEDIKLNVLDYQMVKSLTSIEASAYVAKNKKVRSKLATSRRNYLKYSDLVERIIEKKYEPPNVPSKDMEAECSTAEASAGAKHCGLKRQLSSGSSSTSSADGKKAARCESSNSSSPPKSPKKK